MRLLRNTGTVAAASLVLLMVEVNTNETLAKTLESVPVLGQSTRIVTWNTYRDQTSHYEAEVEIPKIESDGNHYELTNAQIEAYARQFIQDYEDSLKEANGEGNYALESHYTVIGDDDRYVKVFHVDKATGNVMTLPELFADPQGAVSFTIPKNVTDPYR